MNKIIMKDEIITLTENSEFVICDDVSVKLYVTGVFDVLFNVGKNCNVLVYHYNIDSDSNVSIHMTGDESKIEYHYSIISSLNHSINFDVFHEACNTSSNIYNNAVNFTDKKLMLNVTGKVNKNISGCSCNQDNQIINMKDGRSVICPNLLIDCYDVLSSHSAYIGKFDMDEIFYLRSRGISYNESINMLLSAFLIPDFVDREKIGEFLSRIDEMKG